MPQGPEELAQEVPHSAFAKIPTDLGRIDSIAEVELSKIFAEVKQRILEHPERIPTKEEIDAVYKILNEARETTIKNAQPKILRGKELVYDNTKNPDGMKIRKAKTLTQMLWYLDSLRVKS
jgi:ssDNA-specific exonuclease RecJ